MTLHDVLCGFHAGRVLGTSTTDMNIAQDLASVYQYPLLLVFLDLIKAYENFLGPYTEDLGGIWGGAKNAGRYGGVMVTKGFIHPIEWVSWSTVQGNPRSHIRVPDISDTL